MAHDQGAQHGPEASWCPHVCSLVRVNAGSNMPKCADVKILSWAGFSVISRVDGDCCLRFLVADRGGATAVLGLAS